MKSYKEMAEIMEKKINESMGMVETEPFYVSGLIDSWIAFIKRDTETPEIEKHVKLKKIIGLIERKLETVEPYGEAGDSSINLTFSYIALRQELECDAEDEKKARLLHLQA